MTNDLEAMIIWCNQYGELNLFTSANGSYSAFSDLKINSVGLSMKAHSGYSHKTPYEAVYELKRRIEHILDAVNNDLPKLKQETA